MLGSERGLAAVGGGMGTGEWGMGELPAVPGFAAEGTPRSRARACLASAHGPGPLSASVRFPIPHSPFPCFPIPHSPFPAVP
jgi:hypothetical protein